MKKLLLFLFTIFTFTYMGYTAIQLRHAPAASIGIAIYCIFYLYNGCYKQIKAQSKIVGEH